MSSLQDFNQILIDFENEIKNLKDITGAYNKMQNLIQLQIELSSKIDANMQQISEVIDKQNDLDLSKQLKSITLLSSHINELTNIIELNANKLSSETNEKIEKLEKGIGSIISTKTNDIHNKIEDELIKISKKNTNEYKEISTEIKGNFENIINTYKENKQYTLDKLNELIDKLSNNQKENSKALSKLIDQSETQVDSIAKIVNDKLEAIEKNILEYQKQDSKKSKTIKLVMILTLILAISANIIIFVK